MEVNPIIPNNPPPNNSEPSKPLTDKSPAEKLSEALAEAKKEKQEGSIKAIKTYQSDVAEAIQRDNVSVIKMAVAEKRRQEKQGLTAEAVGKESKKRVVIIAASVVLVVAGFLIVGYFLISKTKNTGVLTVNLPHEIIHPDKQVEIKLDSVTLQSFLSQFQAIKPLSLDSGSVESVVVTVRGNLGNATSVDQVGRKVLSTQDFMNLLQARLPGSLYRSLSGYLVGFYQNSNGPEPFLILKTDSYQNAFSGMLQWESNMQADLAALFGLPTGNGNPNFVPTPFKDEVFDNRDTRTLLDENGNILLIYSFLDPNTIVLVQSHNAFDEILSRYLQNKQLQ
ncbi:MAG TPA: hypothetical protein VFA52_03505 [Candidatus Paceibacterota bacterium]|nr:hypothetical protein [Candidatus Paceibacterota bacterium]